MATQKKSETFTTEGREAVEVEHTVVPPEQGQEHGFIGAVRSDKDRDALTVAGVTGEAAKAADTSKPGTRSGGTTKSGS